MKDLARTTGRFLAWDLQIEQSSHTHATQESCSVIDAMRFSGELGKFTILAIVT
jgi:hypothetical protein